MTSAAPKMNQEQIDAFLEAPRHAIVAPLRVEGAPQLSPVWYLYEEGRLYFSIWVESAKYRQLSRDSRVTVCVDAGHPDARFVTLYGTAELIDEESHWRENLEWRIVRRYHQSDEEARRWQDENSGPGRSSLVVVSPERIIGRDFN